MNRPNTADFWTTLGFTLLAVCLDKLLKGDASAGTVGFIGAVILVCVLMRRKESDVPGRFTPTF